MQRYEPDEADMRNINRNYQDYLREFYSGKSDKVLKSIEFVVHKNRSISYLQEFVQQLQNKSIRIENIIKSLPQKMVSEVLERVIESELEIPHPNSEIQTLRENAIKENIYGKWQSLSDWFISTESHSSESRKVMDVTDEVIRKIIQNAALIVQFLTIICRQFCPNLAIMNHTPHEVMRLSAIFNQKN